MNHVLHVITTINRGGAENHLFYLVRAQIKQGFTVSVAYLKGDGYWTDAMVSLGVRIIPLGLKSYKDLAPIIKLRALIRLTTPDIIHAHMPPAELYSRFALLNLKPPPIFVISKHNDEPFFKGFGHAAVSRWVSLRALRIISISNAVNHYTTKYIQRPKAPVTTVHYGIDATPYETVSDKRRQEVLDELSIPPNAFVIGSVTRFVPQKGLHILLKSYARYLLTATLESRLVMVGSGPQELELRSLARQLCLEQNIVWAGFREDIPSIMNAFDLLVLTSLYEGFGLVLLEAMSASRPVIASRVSAIPEIVQHGLTGLLCSPGDHECFAQAMLLLEDPELRTSFGAAGHDRVLELFTVERMSVHTCSIYEECFA
jgi:glycosyltransferase involved in cell wall biosynthesis